MNADNTPMTIKKPFGIRERLFIGFAAIIIIFIFSMGIAIFYISKTENFSNNFIDNELPAYNELVNLNSSVLIAQNSLQTWLLTSADRYKSETLSAWEQIQKTLINLDSFTSNKNEMRNSLQDIKLSLNELKSSQLKVLSTADKNQATQIMISEVIPKLLTISHELGVLDSNNGLFDIQNQTLTRDSHVLLSDMHTLKLFEYGAILVAIVLATLCAILTTQAILPSLTKSIQIAHRIASGERNIKVHVTSNDEAGQLLSSLKTMQYKINENEKKLELNEKKSRDLFNQIVKSAKSFSAHSSRVASGDLREHLAINDNDLDIMIQLGSDLNKMTENLSSLTQQIIQACQDMVTTVNEVHYAVDAQSAGASEQASSVNEITASLSEIEKSSAQTMMKAKALGESAERTREKGELGLTSVDQSVDGMKSIKEKVQLIAQTILDLSHQTQQVGEITAVVNNLAQQSKMLALNAAIEASKAGEAGKGFAVVASEVKNLAEQSEQATLQVQKILENIRHAADKAVMVTEEGTKGVDSGTQLVMDTGDIIRSLNEVIHETTIATQQIESAVRQEGAGIEQISAGMKEINQVIASFVESAKQTTDAISNLSDIANSLKSYIDTYKI